MAEKTPITTELEQDIDNNKLSMLTTTITTYSITVGSTFQKMPFATVVSSESTSDALSWHNGSDRITPNKAGIYSINAGMFTTGHNNRTIIAVYKNGANIRSGHSGGGTGDYGLDVSVDVPMNGTTDYLEIWTLTFSSVPRVVGLGSPDTFFQVTYLGESA